MTVGDRIRNKRESLGMAQTELAEKVKISKQTLYKYENNIITNIPSDKIEMISNVLDVSPAYLMGWGNPTKDDSELLADIVGDMKLMECIKKINNMNASDKQSVYDYIDYISSKK